MLERIIPRPKYAAYRGGKYKLPEELRFEYGGFEPYCAAAFCERSGRKNTGSGERIVLEREDMPGEAYRLSVSESGVSIAAGSERGVIWALTTLYKLMDGDGNVPACVISDAPGYAHRGLSLDCARHFFPAAEVMRVIEGMALAKLNVLHWHLSDDQGWRIESKKFPALNEKGGEYYTQDEIKEITGYASRRGVEIIPEIDLPGHTSAILAAFPELSCTGEQVELKRTGGIYGVILCAGKERVFDFIGALLDELCPLFPAERFHIGGDEAPKTMWQSCPDCAARMKKLGLSEPEQLQGYFACRVSEMLRAHGKRPVCWNEALRSGIVPENAEIQYWTLQHRRDMEKYADRGGRWIYSDMFELYFDYPHSMTPLRKVYGVKPHLGRKTYAHGGLTGFEACLWSEHISDRLTLERHIFPRAYALAELAWSGSGDYEDFELRLGRELELAARAGICCTDREHWDPRGRPRLEEALGHFVKMNAGLPAEVMELTKPSREFVQSFLTEFFRLSDLPALLRSMKRKKYPPVNRG